MFSLCSTPLSHICHDEPGSLSRELQFGIQETKEQALGCLPSAWAGLLLAADNAQCRYIHSEGQVRAEYTEGKKDRKSGWGWGCCSISKSGQASLRVTFEQRHEGEEGSHVGTKVRRQ